MEGPTALVAVSCWYRDKRARSIVMLLTPLDPLALRCRIGDGKWWPVSMDKMSPTYMAAANLATAGTETQ